MKVLRRCSHDFADLSPIDACVSSRVCEPDRAYTNHSTDGGANTGRTSQKTGTANHHLSPWILEVLASEQRLSSVTSGRCNLDRDLPKYTRRTLTSPRRLRPTFQSFCQKGVNACHASVLGG